MNPVGWFEIPVSDVPRAKKFYETVFGFKMTTTENGPLQSCWFPMTDGKGASGALVKGESYIPSHQGTTIYFSCPSIEKAIEAITKIGGRVLQPKKSIGEHGFIAHFEDSEGNRVSLHSRS